jgi:hypothetical protein
MEGEAFAGYEGRVEIAVPVTSAAHVAGPARIEVRVRYQACNETMCFLPRTETVTLEVPTSGAGA